MWEAFRYHSRTFSMATRLLPRNVQMPIAILYLFCRRVDSLADNDVFEIGTDAALEELSSLRHKLTATLEARPPDEYLWRHLAHVHQQFNLVPEALHELLDGAEWDLKGRTVRTEADLIHYANLVGGSVGVMVLPFLVRDRADVERLEVPARNMGIAMQLTNILRDVGEDFNDLDRLYLPEQWLSEYGIAESHLQQDDVPASYPLLLERLMREAENRYEASISQIDALPFNVRMGIRSAARMYREIMNEVRRRRYDNLTGRAYVSFWRKASLIVYDGYERRKSKLHVRRPARIE